MANEREPAYRTFHRKLLALYPRAFRERFGESMEQTFDDLCREQEKRPGPGFVLRMSVDTAAGIVREHVLQIGERNTMSDTITNPKWAAIVSFVLFLPFLLSFTISMFEIEPLMGPFKSLTSLDGQQLNTLGRIIIFGGVFLLPVAFLVNLSSITRRTIEKKVSFRPHPINVLLGGAVLFFILLIGRWMVVEAINCSTRGICD